jgi:hypothetical protein
LVVAGYAEAAVDEREWLECPEPQKMLDFIKGKVSGRKLRLFSCACFRRMWSLLPDDHVKKVVEVAERKADGLATDQEQAGVRPEQFTMGFAILFAAYVRHPAADADLLRCILGNPFRLMALDPAWLSWRDGLVRQLAQTAYDERQLPSGHLDPDRLAVLADALEEAGCQNEDILGHLRQPGAVHVRGCHVVDLLLAKE